MSAYIRTVSTYRDGGTVVVTFLPVEIVSPDGSGSVLREAYFSLLPRSPGEERRYGRMFDRYPSHPDAVCIDGWKTIGGEDIRDHVIGGMRWLRDWLERNIPLLAEPLS